MLKVIAMITMIINHICYGFYPGMIWLPVLMIFIGWPIWCYYVALAIRYTKDIEAYKRRLLILALITTPIHYLYFNNMLFNAVFLFWISAELLTLKNKEYINVLKVILLLVFVKYVEFGYIGLLMIFLFYFYKIEINLDMKFPRLNKYIFYIFYPGHILILFLIKYYLTL